MPGTHKAAILPEKGSRLTIAERETPEPGPNECLVEIKAVGLNIVECFQRDFGLPPIPAYPSVVGSDAAGIVTKVGPCVSNVAPGTRVLGLVSAFFLEGNPDYGAFQQYALASAHKIVPLPDFMSFEEGASFPLTFGTALTGFTSIGISLDTRYSPEDKQAILIWGGASAVGTFAVQYAKVMGFTTYVTARPDHHEYLKKLGADTCFDYRASDVVEKIVAAAKKDRVTLVTVHAVVKDSLQPCLDVLKQTKGDKAASVTYSPPLPEDHPTLDDTTIVFNFPPGDASARDAHYKECFEALHKGLEAGTIVQSPPVQVEAGGLDGLNAAMDKLNAGVSLTKIVVPL